jgi:hypothetical protein
MLIQHYAINPWVGYVIATLMLVAASVAGRALRVRRLRRHPDAVPPKSFIVKVAVFGLLALMIGITFATALTHVENRIKAKSEEADAIAATALRADLLPEPQRAAVRKLLDGYVQVDTDLMNDSHDSTALDQAASRSKQLQAELWSHAMAIGAADSKSATTELFVHSLSEMINLQEKDLAAVRSRVPSEMFLLLYGIAIVAIGSSSYLGGLAGRPGRTPDALIAMVIGLAIGSVADTDRWQVSNPSMLSRISHNRN